MFSTQIEYTVTQYYCVSQTLYVGLLHKHNILFKVRFHDVAMMFINLDLIF